MAGTEQPSLLNAHPQSNFCSFLPVSQGLGEVSKTPVTEIVREGGGVPPLSVNFFPLGFLEPAVREGGGGVPPLSVKKKSIKNWPKNSVF